MFVEKLWKINGRLRITRYDLFFHERPQPSNPQGSGKVENYDSNIRKQTTYHNRTLPAAVETEETNFRLNHL